MNTSYYHCDKKTADTLNNLPLINIEKFKTIASSISKKINILEIETVEDIYNQADAFSGTFKSVYPNLDMLSNFLERINFHAWYIVEDSNNHHCIIG